MKNRTEIIEQKLEEITDVVIAGLNEDHLSTRVRAVINASVIMSFSALLIVSFG